MLAISPRPMDSSLRVPFLGREWSSRVTWSCRVLPMRARVIRHARTHTVRLVVSSTIAKERRCHPRLRGILHSEQMGTRGMHRVDGEDVHERVLEGVERIQESSRMQSRRDQRTTRTTHLDSWTPRSEFHFLVATSPGATHAAAVRERSSRMT